ncbi:tetratricopeptide repeat protein [bacterium]|nr:MAG: tetratricopeptide repeat protein [bacterium]
MDGTVEGVRKVPVFGLMMKIITPFSSVGSPVFNENGKLVGIVLMKLEDYGGTAWVVPIGKTTVFLKDAEEPLAYDEWSERQTTSWFDTPTGSYMKGFVHYWAGDYRAASPYLEAAAGDDRYSREAYFLLGCCNDAMEKYENSVEAYSMAARLDPASHSVYIKLAEARMKKGDLNGSISSCWKALQLHPNNYDAFLLLSRIYNAQGDFQKALAMSYGALKVKPNHPDAYVEAGLAYRSMNRFPDAIRLFQRAIEIQHNCEKAYWHLALAYFYLGDIDSAMKICDTLKSINPEMSEKLYAGIGR